MGRVTNYDPQYGYYTIEYSDGDGEVMSHATVTKHLRKNIDTQIILITITITILIITVITITILIIILITITTILTILIISEADLLCKPTY